MASGFTWYRRLVAKPDDPATVLAFVEYFQQEYEEAVKGLKPQGRIDQYCLEYASLMEYRYGQLQALESALVFYEKRANTLKTNKKKYYLESYPRALSDRQAEQYAAAEPEVSVAFDLVNEIALLRNQIAGITKAYDSQQYMIGHIINLRKHMIEDAMF